ncbi:vitamin K epoxide reductase complex subunit 1-like protein 1 [Musca vetustissima]|uniref:vitamin K epoxide reductase complex subunit 1-like protein 1 n=1 Tax=Musca vetustissima TaxID=27455 RepID=UPI002AB65036|nr:vitamin K epoxide reductase complex subunit 1-like protein 1 [Musca vetustissima]
MIENGLLRLWCILGFLVSAYATYVEINLILNKDYKALCDLGPKISCTAAFSSAYGKGFGFLNSVTSTSSIWSKWNPPNGIFGLIYYAALFATANNNQTLCRVIQFIFCILSNLMSIYLAYILYILDDICVVCISIYVINLLCLWEMLRTDKWTQYFRIRRNQSLKAD